MTVDLGKSDCNVILAGPADVLETVSSLSEHMDTRQRERFRDKLCRYVCKSDRDLLIAVAGQSVVGFYTIIARAALSPELPEDTRELLRDFACCTGLLVHPDRRRQGIGARLHRRGEQWAGERGKPGLWLSTRRHADWYRRHFGYEEVGRVLSKGIERTIVAKRFTT